MHVGRSPSYLVRQNHGYCFRAHVPPDISPHVHLKEIRYSLGLVTKRQARAWASKLGRYVWELFEEAREDIRRRGCTTMNRERIKELIYKYFKEQLEEDERWRFEKTRPSTYEELEGEFHSYSSKFDEVNEDLIRVDLRRVTPQVERFLEAESITDIKPDSIEFRKLAFELLKAQSYLLKIFGCRTEGDLKEEARLKKEYMEVLGEGRGISDTPVADQKKPTTHSSKTIKEALEIFKEEKRRAEAFTGRSAVDAYHSLDLFCSLVGVDYMSELNHETMNNFFERLKNWPSNRTKRKEYRDLSIEELSAIQIPEKDRISVATIDKHMVWVGSFMDFAEKRGYVEKNYARGLKMPRKASSKRDDEKTAVFTKEQLESIFRSEEYMKDTFEKDWQFYIPVIALYTGMRQSEIAQLGVDDIEKINGVWCVRLEQEETGTEAKKRLKNKSSRRVVPLHDFLVYDLKLPSLLDKRRAEGQTRLFPDIRYQNGHYGDQVSKWFGKYRKRVGIVSEPGAPKLDFHSFRHTMINTAKQKGVSIQHLAEVVGHSTGSITMELYGKRYEPELPKREVIDRLDFGIDLSHLKSSRFVIK